MDLISDGLLIAAALAAVFYCWAISARLAGLKRQSAELSTRLDEFNTNLAEARKLITETRESAASEAANLSALIAQANLLQDRLDNPPAASNRGGRKMTTKGSQAVSEAEIKASMKKLAAQTRARTGS